MAGLGRKTFVATEVLTAANVNGYLMDQTVMKYANTTAASSAVGTALSEGMQFYLSNTDEQVFYNGTTFAKQNGTTNAIINGAFEINQRGFTTSTTNGVYVADRLPIYHATGTNTATLNTFTPGTEVIAGFSKYATFTSSGQTGVTAELDLVQRVEDVRTFAGQTVTFSFYAKAASGTPKIAPTIYQAFGTGGSAGVTTQMGQVTLSTSWARYSVTATLPSITGKTVGTGSYIQATLWMSAGTNYNADTASLGIQNNTFDITGVQLEAGSVATPFRRSSPTLQGELAACQRYYYRVQKDSASSAYATLATGMAYGSANAHIFFPFPVPMRTSPSAVEYSTISTLGVLASNLGTLAATSATFANATQFGSGVNFSVSSGLTTGNATALNSNNSSSSYVGFSAEL